MNSPPFIRMDYPSTFFGSVRLSLVGSGLCFHVTVVIHLRTNYCVQCFQYLLGFADRPLNQFGNGGYVMYSASTLSHQQKPIFCITLTMPRQILFLLV